MGNSQRGCGLCQGNDAEDRETPWEGSFGNPELQERPQQGGDNNKHLLRAC